MGLGRKAKIPAYESTTMQNPYASAYVNQDGASGYTLNSFLTGMNNMAESTLPSLYNQLLNPSLDNPVSKARMEAFTEALDKESYKQFENNLNALSQRGLLRSSAVNDMSNKLSEYQSQRIAEYADELLANNTADITSMLSTFLNQYLLGANIGQNALSDAMSANQLLNNHNLSASQQMLQNSSLLNNGLSSELGLVGLLLSKLGSSGKGG